MKILVIDPFGANPATYQTGQQYTFPSPIGNKTVANFVSSRLGANAVIMVFTDQTFLEYKGVELYIYREAQGPDRPELGGADSTKSS